MDKTLFVGIPPNRSNNRTRKCHQSPQKDFSQFLFSLYMHMWRAVLMWCLNSHSFFNFCSIIVGQSATTLKVCTMSKFQQTPPPGISQYIIAYSPSEHFSSYNIKVSCIRHSYNVMTLYILLTQKSVKLAG